MDVVTLGPLAFASDRLAAIIGFFVFLGVGSWLARRYDTRLAPWTTAALLSGLIAARALHVLMHLDSFLTEPWRALYVWQGGFSMVGGAIGVAITLVFLMRESRQTLPLAAVTLAAGCFVWFALTMLWQAAEGPAAPRFTLANLDGSQFVALSERAGRPAVVNLWATWCPPCRREMPLLAEVAAARADVDFIFANQGEGPAAIKAYLEDQNLRLETILLDPAHSLSRHYAAPGMPVTLFLGADGQVVTTHFGEISREALNAAIARLIPADKE
ncbi:MAG: TlpA disulfide reductase family protein [Rhizobium sp.]|nr:TlpA disulfide reductase family protein [Rhizobium sp.]